MYGSIKEKAQQPYVITNILRSDGTMDALEKDTYVLKYLQVNNIYGPYDEEENLININPNEDNLSFKKEYLIRLLSINPLEEKQLRSMKVLKFLSRTVKGPAKPTPGMTFMILKQIKILV